MTTKNQRVPTTLEEYLALPYRLEITSNEYGGYVVRYPDLLGCVTQVEQIEDAIPMAREILAGWLEIALEDGMEIPLPRQTESFSGKFVLRMPKSLHRALAEEAKHEGASLNQYVVTILAARQRHQSCAAPERSDDARSAGSSAPFSSPARNDRVAASTDSLGR